MAKVCHTLGCARRLTLLQWLASWASASGYTSRGGCSAELAAWAGPEHPIPPAVTRKADRHMGTFLHLPRRQSKQTWPDEECNRSRTTEATFPHHRTSSALLCPTGPWLGTTRGLARGPGRAGQGRAGQSCCGRRSRAQPNPRGDLVEWQPSPSHPSLHPPQHPGFKSKKKGRQRCEKKGVRCAGRPPRGWARPPLYSASCAVTVHGHLHAQFFGPKEWTRCVRAAGGNPTQAPKAHVFRLAFLVFPVRNHPCLTMRAYHFPLAH